jgi:hypothetical protein
MAKKQTEDRTKPIMVQVRVGTPRLDTRGYGGYVSIQYDSQEQLDPDYTSLESVIEQVLLMRETYASAYSDLKFEADQNCGCYQSDCGCRTRYFLVGKRLESDLEFELRLEEEAKREADRLERERAEFERLKKQFGE